MISGYNKDILGEQTLTITYAENDISKTATFKITVTNNMTGITIKNLPLSYLISLKKLVIYHPVLDSWNYVVLASQNPSIN